MTMTTSIDLAPARRFLEGMSGGAKPTPVLCAVSGGMDSMCLLHLLTTWGRERNMTVTAAHFNHQLRGKESDRDEAFVRSWCEARNIPFVCGRGDVRAYAEEMGQTLEEAARTLRYRFLEEQKQALGCTFVLTAHHADDNAETMLLNLLRGTGLRGLAGIPETRGDIARPFLSVTRESLAAYAKENQVEYVEDSTNALDDVSRNLLRHKVLPVLRELNPKAVENMSRTAQQLRRDEEALGRMAEALLRRCRAEEGRWALPAEDCMDAERAVLTRAVHELLAHAGGHRKDLTAAHVDAVCALVYGSAGKTVSLPYGMTACRTERERGVAVKAAAPEETAIAVGETVTFGGWRVSLTEDGTGRGISLPENGTLTVTLWRRDDRMVLPGSRGERSLKRLCADAGISPMGRDAMPVFRVNGQAAAVPGLGIDLRFTPEKVPAAYISFHQDSEESIYEK